MVLDVRHHSTEPSMCQIEFDAAMTKAALDKLYVNLSASQALKRLKGHGFGVRKVEAAGQTTLFRNFGRPVTFVAILRRCTSRMALDPCK